MRTWTLFVRTVMSRIYDLSEALAACSFIGVGKSR